MKIRYSTIAGCLLALLLCNRTLCAERYGGEFLNIPVGAKAYALGGAFGPVADDASAIYWNPAGLAQLDVPEIMVAHTELFGNLANHDYIAIVWPMRPLTIGAGWIRLGVDDIPRFSHTVGTPPQGSFGDNENAFFISTASCSGFDLPGRQRVTLRCGGSIKLIYNRLDDRRATGTGLDAGLQAVFPLGRGAALAAAPRLGMITLSVMAADVGGTVIAWNTARRHEDISCTKYRFGLSYALALARLRSTAVLSCEAATDPIQRNRIGAEISYRRMIALRAGYDGHGTTAGAGLAYWRLNLDYGFSRHDLGNSHRVSAGYRF